MYYSFFSTANTQKSHNFWNVTLKHQNHTPNLQNHTLIIGLRLSFQFHEALCAKHNTQFSVQHTLL